MGKYTYSTEVGSYGDDVRLSISLEIKDAVSAEDYQVLNAAFDNIEAIAIKHQTKPAEETE